MKRQQSSIATLDSRRFQTAHSDFSCPHPKRQRLFPARCLDSRRSTRPSAARSRLRAWNSSMKMVWADGSLDQRKAATEKGLVDLATRLQRSPVSHCCSKVPILGTRIYADDYMRTSCRTCSVPVPRYGTHSPPARPTGAAGSQERASGIELCRRGKEIAKRSQIADEDRHLID